MYHEHLLDFNAWIFCLSLIDELSEIKILKERFECDSCYFISDYDLFEKRIQMALAENLKAQPKTLTGKDRIFPRYPSNESIYIDGWRQPVEYGNADKYMRFEFETLSEFYESGSYVQVERSFWFRKSKLYEVEKEFRLCFYASGERASRQIMYSTIDNFCDLNVDLEDCISLKPVPCN